MSITRALARAGAVAALALATAQPAAALPTAHGTAPAPAAAVQRAVPPTTADVVCTVNDNGVNYRSGPGSQYPVMGTVNRGQKLNAHGREGSWVMGDLWGGPTGVWIHVAYLDC
ncbi:SH3 domain-containing protein [Streptomyces sp. MST-110588]|uniref:SH3 domain-containing protein n=1 Tax=Streptomyces sp. MST-110588 TaxID=2833628 RepID=UPI001F5CEFF4|nr:SH3 domain-containing protein [Streptomyces sp. MST-110588]UNO43484.1 SH3 domain-containing protein [Streptomyces sp. MST-110588]